MTRRGGSRYFHRVGNEGMRGSCFDPTLYFRKSVSLQLTAYLFSFVIRIQSLKRINGERDLSSGISKLNSLYIVGLKNNDEIRISIYSF